MSKKKLNIKDHYEIKKQRCIVAWSDFLGFGASLDSIHWDFQNIENDFDYKILWRLEKLKPVLKSIGGIDTTSFNLNDGFAYNIDIRNEDDFESLNIFWNRILTVFKYHKRLNELDFKEGFPGIRTVLASGDRLVDSKVLKGYPEAKETTHDYFKGMPKSNIAEPNVRVWGESSWLKNKVKRIATYTPIEFQLNLAFAKAYILDSIGKAGGMKGSNLFFDKSFIDILIPEMKTGKNKIEPDDWGNYIEYVDSIYELHIIIKKNESNNGDKKIGELYLKNVNNSLKTRFGTTSVFQLSRLIHYEPYKSIELSYENN